MKYKHKNFSLDIIEYCEPYLLIEREQYYLDLLKPEYNILKMKDLAIGRLGSETLFFGKKHKPQSIVKMKTNRSIFIKIINIDTGLNIIVKGNENVARYLNIGLSTLSRHKRKWKFN